MSRLYLLKDWRLENLRLKNLRLKNLVPVTVAALVFCLSSVAQDCPAVKDWKYDTMSCWPTKYPQCCSQSNEATKDIQQSPINIRSSTEDQSLTLEVHYNGVEVPVVNNGHSIEVEYEHQAAAPRNYVKYKGTEYTLQQFHFHQPSEHQINGPPGAAMEVHLVHKDGNGKYLVVGVLVNKGTANEGFGKILANIGGHSTVNAIQMIPGTQPTNHLKFYTYMGSLTTPPCTPGVTWVVLKDPITFSAEQIKTYGDLDGGKFAQTFRYPQIPITRLTVTRNFKP